MNTIEISYDCIEYQIIAEKKFVKSFLNRVCKEVGVDNCEFSVSFITEEHMHELNKEYRNIDDSTDILSFAVADEVDDFCFITPEKRKKNIGDMLICPQVMNRNAEYFNEKPDVELKRLLIHGVLHLSGENHLSNDIQKEPMLQKQEAILKQISVDF